MCHTCRFTSEHRVTVATIGFEGPHRAGKGTQCALLRDWLAERGIPSLIVRGDGSRPGLGTEPGDPPSIWWQAAYPHLHSSQATPHDWDIAAYRLARELLVWRDRVLPCLLNVHGKNLGVLLVDRSLLSRAMVPRAMGVRDVFDHLYPECARTRGQRIIPELVCPDLIVNLVAPRSVLLARLVPHDPKHDFRKRLIEQMAACFRDAPDYLPKSLRDRVIAVDASREIGAVFGDTVALVEAHLAGWNPLDEPARCSLSRSVPPGLLCHTVCRQPAFRV